MRPIPLLVALTACDPGWDIPDDSGGAGFSGFADVLDQSVNRASVGVEDGALVLRTESGDNAVGAFNGEGTGNKAIGGLPSFDGRSLAELSGLAMETTAVTGGSTPYFNVLVQLECGCDGELVVVADSTVATATDLGDGVTRYAYAADAPQWKAVGGLDDLLPEHLASTGGSLAEVADAYPDACLVDADTGDRGLPKGVVNSAILVILGDSLNTTAYEQQIGALEIGDQRYED